MLLLATSGRRQLMVLALWDDGKIVVGIFEGGGDGDGENNARRRLSLLFVHDYGKVGGAQTHIHPFLLMGGGLAWGGGVENVLARAVSL